MKDKLKKQRKNQERREEKKKQQKICSFSYAKKKKTILAWMVNLKEKEEIWLMLMIALSWFS